VVDGDGVDTHVAEEIGRSDYLVATAGTGGLELHAFYVTAAGVLRHAELEGATWGR